jgi:hypothetical protein
MGIQNGTAEAANGTSPDTPSFDFAHFDVHRKGRFSPTLVDAPVNKKHVRDWLATVPGRHWHGLSPVCLTLVMVLLDRRLRRIKTDQNSFGRHAFPTTRHHRKTFAVMCGGRASL